MVRHSWRTQLKGADSVEAVLAVVTQYLGEWRPEEVSSLPKGCWPSSLSSRKDVIDCAFRLSELHANFDGSGASLARLQELLLFFTHVSVRITQVERSRADEGSANASAFLDTDPTGGATEPPTANPVTGKKPRKNGES